MPDKEEQIIGSPDEFKDEPTEHIETPEQLEHKMHIGGANVDVYTAEGREELVEEGEISAEEQGFAAGATNSDSVHCTQCDKVLNKEETVEREINHKKYVFCSKDCAAKGLAKKE